MDIQDVLRILKNGAEKPKDDLNDYTKGKRDGQVQAYSHAWTLVKNLSISGVSKSFYCQSDIEMNGKCNEQCDHCKEYYKPLEQ